MIITIDKIASVARNAKIKNQTGISKKVIAEEGSILAVEVLEDKKTYNNLELKSGRLSRINKGDIIAVALGNRRALKGYVGNVPKKLKAGDIINILNLGGVAGICTSENVEEVGHALKVKVLGTITKKGELLNINQFSLFKPTKTLKSKVPLIVVSGTCMNVGKTSAACEIIKYLTRSGSKVFAAKLAGIAALRDTENMKDHGAKQAVSIIDGGLTSTVLSKQSLQTTKGAINYLSKENPDYIVIEFGDGIFGEYGVMEILEDPEIQQNIAAHISLAHDPMGAAQLVTTCKEIGIRLDLISGPVSDNSIGTEFIQKKLGVTAINALTDGEKLFKYLQKSCLKK